MSVLAGDEAWNLVAEVDSAFLRYGAPGLTMEPSEDEAETLNVRLQLPAHASYP